jgi:hypothetical protein
VNSSNTDFGVDYYGKDGYIGNGHDLAKAMLEVKRILNSTEEGSDALVQIGELVGNMK